MKKKLSEKAKLLSKVSSQQKEIVALKKEVAKLKKHYEPLIADFNDYLPLREILTLMPGNIFWKNKDGKLLGCNNNNAKIFGFPSHLELEEKYSQEFLPITMADQIDKNDQAVITSGEAKIFEEIGVDSNNEIRVFFSQKVPLFDDAGSVTGLLGVSIDITDRKKIENELKLAKEKAEALSQAKSNFLAVVNHELRSPLTSIIGLINFLKQGKLSKEEEKSTIIDLENCSDYLLSLVNDILDFSKLEADKMPVNFSMVDIRALIEEVTRIMTALAMNKGLTLQAHFDTHIPELILSDAKIVRQILVNIISNAIKYTENGGIDVSVNMLAINQNKVSLKMAVKDTGIGIPENKIESIFEPFRQLEDIYNRQSSRSGTGLGLAIVKKLADILELKIQVISEGAGSTFSLQGEFAIAGTEIADKMSNQKNLENDPPLCVQRKSIKVLLVEDDEIVRRIHKSMLVESGCEVDVATCGFDALKMVSDHDILFVDIGLSDITGFEVISAVRKNKTIPIIALTGYTGEEEREKCVKAGANRMVNKPITLEGLQAVLSDFIG